VRLSHPWGLARLRLKFGKKSKLCVPNEKGEQYLKKAVRCHDEMMGNSIILVGNLRDL